MAIFQETKVKISIVVTLTILFICIGVLPLLISNWRIISINKEELQFNLQENFSITVGTVSSGIASFLKRYQDQMDAFEPKALAALQSTSGQAPADLPGLMKDSNFLKVQLLDQNGKGWHAQRLDFTDSHVEEMETQAFRQALQKGSTYYSAPYYDKVDSTVIWIIAEPVFGAASDKPVG